MPFASTFVSPAEPLVGSALTVQAEFRNDANAAVDPTGLTLQINRPDGSVVSVPRTSLSNPAAGTWQYAVTADQAGTWEFEWQATGPAIAVDGAVTVNGSAVQQQRFTGGGPCTAWCSRAEVLNGWTPPAALGDELLDMAIDAASSVCFQFGGRRWPGVCWDRVLPTLACQDGTGGWMVWPMAGGQAGIGPSMPSTSAGWDMRMPGVPSLDLGAEPIIAIEAVRIRGVVLTPTAYRIVDGRYLARIDGSSWPWPLDPHFDPPGIEVDFTYGAAPPAGGRLAAIGLARQLGLALAGDQACALNRRVRTIVREGETLDLAVPGLIDNLREGYTGVPELDLFIASENPEKLRRAGRVIVPGQGAVHRLG